MSVPDNLGERIAAAAKEVTALCDILFGPIKKNEDEDE